MILTLSIVPFGGAFTAKVHDSDGNSLASADAMSAIPAVVKALKKLDLSKVDEQEFNRLVRQFG